MFQDRYKSEAVESDSYFTTVLKYIHQNPLKAGLCGSIGEYKWSSYKEYVQKNVIVDYEPALGISCCHKNCWRKTLSCNV